MPIADNDGAALFKSAAASIAAVVSGSSVGVDGQLNWVERSYREIGDAVRVRLSLAEDSPDRPHDWALNIFSGTGSVTLVLKTAQPSVAIASFVWTDRMLRTRFAELQELLTTGAVPRCVNNCGDLHNFLDWNMAGDAEELIEAGEQVSLEGAASPMEWPCTILNAVDSVIDGWLGQNAERSLAADATAEQMAGLLCCHNAEIEEQVAGRFVRMSHNEAREVLRHAAGLDGSNLTTKVMALVKAACRAGRKGNDSTGSFCQI